MVASTAVLLMCSFVLTLLVWLHRSSTILNDHHNVVLCETFAKGGLPLCHCLLSFQEAESHIDLFIAYFVIQTVHSELMHLLLQFAFFGSSDSRLEWQFLQPLFYG